jgi:hypothetical protein
MDIGCYSAFPDFKVEGSECVDRFWSSWRTESAPQRLKKFGGVEKPAFV